MSRLVRMDASGHSQLAEWTGPGADFEAAAATLRAELEEGFIAVRDDGEPVAQGFLGDLLDHEPREIHLRTGLVIERGGLGTWLVGEAGAILLPGGRRAHCFCVRAKGDDLPPSDRVAHLLLALRSDEVGFATIANHSFSGAIWRVRRRMPRDARP